MNEKKLTDDELLRLLEIFAKDDEPNGVRLLAEGALDLIHRLQDEKQKVVQDYYCEAQHCDRQKDVIAKQKAEIERLTEENEYLDMVAKQALTDYQNTQVQVDELTDKLGKVLSGIKADELLLAKGVEQAVKDTAKEILDDLRNTFIEQSSYGCDANQHIGYYDYVVKIGLVIEQVEEYAKLKYGIEYGVEVE